MEHSIKWLEKWYKNRCNSKWEHDYGISITTLDNPGWSVKIDLEGTNYNKNFESVHVKKSDTEWIDCDISLNEEWLAKGRDVMQFKGSGGWNQLEDIINVFKNIVDKE